jgi:hypothetical protein
MAEVTISSESGLYSLERGGGRGAYIGGFQITVSDAETLDTGLDTVEGIGAIDLEDTDIDAASSHTWVDSVSGGVITFQTAEIDTYGDSTDTICWLIVLGRVN